MLSNILKACLGVVQNCHHFQKSTQYAGGGGGGHGLLYAFKNVDYDALHFHTGPLKINILKYSFGREGEGHKKEYSVRF